MKNPWTTELWRMLALFGFSFLAGSLIGQAQLFLIIVLVACLLWHLYYIHQLRQWLNSKGKFHPPQGRGLWREIFDQLYRLQKGKRARKKKLTRFLSRFKESTSAMPDATVVLDHAWQIQWMNTAAKTLLDLKPKKDIGQYITNFIRHPRFKAYLNVGDFTQAIEFQSSMATQAFLSIRIVPYGKNQCLLVARDITRLKQLEEMRQDFIANISHELRTPLTVLNGYLETMIDDDNDSLNSWQPILQSMEQQTTRMKNIVADLLMLSHLENSPSLNGGSHVSVPALLASIGDDAQALSGDKQHIISLDVDPQLCLTGVENELYSIFSNLIFNAVRYTPAKGKISIRWYKKSTGEAHFEVQDEGIGISSDDITRLTERFYRVDVGRSRDMGGTGLGLAIVKHALLRHNTQLHIKSKVGKGSRFMCDFPTIRGIKKLP